MARKRKKDSGQQDALVKAIILITAILNLAKSLVDLIKDLR